MKKTLLSVLFCFPLFGVAQNLISENFDVFPATWTKTNQSVPAGTASWSSWMQGNVTSTTYFNGGAGAHNGSAESYAFASFSSTTGNNTISNWLITPVISLVNGDIISFYTIKGLSGGASVYPDRMQVRISTTGAATVNPVGNTGLGDFTTLALDINPTLTTTDYPTTWTQYTYTVSGLPIATDCKIAFRYFVTSGGPSGANSDHIAIDAFSVDRLPLSTADFFSKSFSIYPNPVDNVLNLSSKTNTVINSVQILDLNGRVVKNANVNNVTENQMNVSDLHAGMYFVEVTSDNGKATSKFIKK